MLHRRKADRPIEAMREGTYVLAEQATSNQQSWQSELDQHGKVTIASSFGSLLWRVGLAIVLVALFIYSRYASGDIGQRGLTIAIVGFALLILACIAFVVKFYGGRSIEVNADGIRMMDGRTHRWSDITTVCVYSPMKSPPMVSLTLSESAWNTTMKSQNAAAKMMHKGNKLVMRDRAIVLPSYLAADPGELAGWLNRLAKGIPDR